MDDVVATILASLALISISSSLAWVLQKIIWRLEMNERMERAAGWILGSLTAKVFPWNSEAERSPVTRATQIVHERNRIRAVVEKVDRALDQHFDSLAHNIGLPVGEFKGEYPPRKEPDPALLSEVMTSLEKSFPAKRRAVFDETKKI